MNAVTLYKKHSMEELVALSKAIREDPANKETPGSLYLLNKKARTKLANIDLAITHHLEDLRTARGQVIDKSGYSGRQSKRR